jgi:methylated-DNA-[protein]-cysteine S-methyltransferase
LQTYTACYRSEIGPFEIVGNQKGILTISFNKAPSVINRNLPACLQECMQQMDEYSFRAVGNANNKNPIPLIIPCHRVIGSDGKLVGFGGGIWRKEWLLEHEQSPLL